MQPTTTQPPQDLARHRAVLNELVDMAHDIARQIHARITAPAPAEAPAPAPTTNPAPAPTTNPAPVAPNPLSVPELQTLANTFDRIARTIRRTVHLAERLGQPPRAHNPAQYPGAQYPGAQHPRAHARHQPPRRGRLTVADLPHISDQELEILHDAECMVETNDLAHLAIVEAIARLREEAGLPPDPNLPLDPNETEATEAAQEPQRTDRAEQAAEAAPHPTPDPITPT